MFDSSAASSAAAHASEMEVRRAAAERQSAHLAARLKQEHASYAELLAEYDLLAARSRQHSEYCCAVSLKGMAEQHERLRRCKTSLVSRLPSLSYEER